MAQLLTRRKAKWANQFRPDILRGDALNPPAPVQARYYSRLAIHINRMCDEAEAMAKQLFAAPAAEVYFAQDASVASDAKRLTNALLKKYNDIFGSLAKPVSEQMVKGADRASSASLHTSMQRLSGGLSLPTSAITAPMEEILKASTTESAALIKSIGTKYLSGVQQAVMRSITTGNGKADLIPYLQKHRGITLNRAKNIAKDQTKKAYSNLARGRMEKLGLEEYEWLHTGGAHEPRPLHVAMSGKIYRFDEPPIIDENTGERGIPGQAIFCSCRMVPVIRFGEKSDVSERPA